MKEVKYPDKELLRFLTCGSVDDGKSTLIGRLLVDSKRVFQDQMKSLEKDTAKHGTVEEGIDYALLMDGLSAEREQGITIDVAYRYFETAKRKFIIADTPGHVQYTRNMVTGASVSDLAVILVDAQNGLTTQSKRHAFIVSLLRIPHIIIAVNKMDLIDYSKEKYDEIVEDFKKFFEKLDINEAHFIPVSALKGDNVVQKSSKTPWYDGSPFLHYLENIYISSDKNLIDFRFPVQYVNRPDSGFRGYSGQIASGTIKPGEEVAVLPSGTSSRVSRIVVRDGDMDSAFAGQSVTLTLEDEIDISRGDMIIRKNNIPEISNRIDAMICWMDEKPIQKNSYYLLKQTTKTVRVLVENINYTINMDTLHREQAESLELNQIARVEITGGQEIFFDSYKNNRATGSFILIDPMTNSTVAAGMIRGVKKEVQDITSIEKRIVSKNIVKEKSGVSQELKEKLNGHRSAVIWLTGLPSSGKSTISRNLEQELFNRRIHTAVLDGDNVRHGLCRDLGFSPEDRRKNIQRVAEAAGLFFINGNITICSFVSPYARDRQFAHDIIEKSKFIEVYVKCPVEVCESRDPKGLYKKARKGEIADFTGINAPYEEPENPDLVIETDKEDVGPAVLKIVEELKKRGIIDDRL